MLKDIEVHCCWGDGPDVLVHFTGKVFLLFEDPQKSHCKHGIVRHGQFDLNSQEARWLAARLISCAENAEQLERSCEDHDETIAK